MEKKDILNLIYSDNAAEVEKGINFITKSLKPNELMNLINENSLNLYEVYSKKSNLTSEKITSFLPTILNKVSVLTGNNIFTCLNECGGCLLTIMFLSVAYNPSLEDKIYNFLINYLGDYNGNLLEKKSFLPCAKKTEGELITNEEKHICERIKKGFWKDYIQGMGVLFSDDNFVEKVKEDAKGTNTFVENFINKNNSFNKSNAKELIEQILSKK